MSLTLEDARALLQEELKDGKFLYCPCCDQACKIYKRKLNSSMAMALIWLARHSSIGAYVDVRHDVPKHLVAMGGEIAKLRFWWLVEPLPHEHGDDGKRTAGCWRVTSTGRTFVAGRIRVNSHVYLYNNQIQGWSDTETSIREALGNKFDYRELMGLPPDVPAEQTPLF